MAIIAKKPENNYTPAPEGLFDAVCVDVIDRGMQQTPWGPKHKVRFRWQLDARDDETGKRYMVQKDYTNSLHERATLRQHLELWRGRVFTAQELTGFDLEKVLGVNCQIQVSHDTDDKGNTWANVQGIMAAARGKERLEPEDYVRECDRQPDDTPIQGEPFEAGEEDVPF